MFFPHTTFLTFSLNFQDITCDRKLPESVPKYLRKINFINERFAWFNSFQGYDSVQGRVISLEWGEPEYDGDQSVKYWPCGEQLEMWQKGVIISNKDLPSPPWPCFLQLPSPPKWPREMNKSTTGEKHQRKYSKREKPKLEKRNQGNTKIWLVDRWMKDR